VYPIISAYSSSTMATIQEIQQVFQNYYGNVGSAPVTDFTCVSISWSFNGTCGFSLSGITAVPQGANAYLETMYSMCSFGCSSLTPSNSSCVTHQVVTSLSGITQPSNPTTTNSASASATGMSG
jgi:hypothetical protein